MTDTLELAKKCGAEHKEMLFGPGDGFIFTESELDAFRAECLKEEPTEEMIEAGAKMFEATLHSAAGFKHHAYHIYMSMVRSRSTKEK